MSARAVVSGIALIAIIGSSLIDIHMAHHALVYGVL